VFFFQAAFSETRFRRPLVCCFFFFFFFHQLLVITSPPPSVLFLFSLLLNRARPCFCPPFGWVDRSRPYTGSSKPLRDLHLGTSPQVSPHSLFSAGMRPNFPPPPPPPRATVQTFFPPFFEGQRGALSFLEERLPPPFFLRFRLPLYEKTGPGPPPVVLGAVRLTAAALFSPRNFFNPPKRSFLPARRAPFFP